MPNQACCSAAGLRQQGFRGGCLWEDNWMAMLGLASRARLPAASCLGSAIRFALLLLLLFPSRELKGWLGSSATAAVAARSNASAFAYTTAATCQDTLLWANCVASWHTLHTWQRRCHCTACAWAAVRNDASAAASAGAQGPQPSACYGLLCVLYCLSMHRVSMV